MVSETSESLSEVLLQFLVQHTSTGVAWTDSSGKITSANDALASLSQRRMQELVGQPLADVLSPSSRDLFQSALTGSDLVASIEMSLNLLTPTGIRRPCSARIWRDGDGVVAVFVDSPAAQPLADVATGAETEEEFLEHLALRLYDTRRYEVPVSVLVCDICNYASLDTANGPSVASRVAAMVGWTLRNLTRRSDYVARISGREFAIVLPGVSLAGALGAAEKLMPALGAVGVETDSCAIAPAVRFGAVAVTDAADLKARDVLEAARFAASAASPGCAEAVPAAAAASAPAYGAA